MLAVSTPLKARLAAIAALAGWAVRDMADLEDRSLVPAAVIECIGAQVAPGRGGRMVSPRWNVTLSVKRQAGAAALLDAALDAVIGSLEGWMPPQAADGRAWEPLSLFSVTRPEFSDAGLVSYVISFDTSALYRGQE
jgi:hypothetical protein